MIVQVPIMLVLGEKVLESSFKFEMKTDEDEYSNYPENDNREGDYDVEMSCFDYVNLEERDVVGYLKESPDNILVISGENRYGVKRTELAEFSNRQANQYNSLVGGLFVQLPTRELIPMLNFCNMLVTKFSVFVIEPTDRMTRVVDCTGEITLRRLSLVNVYRMEQYFKTETRCGSS